MYYFINKFFNDFNNEKKTCLFSEEKTQTQHATSLTPIVLVNRVNQVSQEPQIH